MRATRILPLSKLQFEKFYQVKLTPAEWNLIADDVEGRTENYIDSICSDLAQDFREKTGLFSA
jgi:hypothetical protein